MRPPVNFYVAKSLPFVFRQDMLRRIRNEYCSLILVIHQGGKRVRKFKDRAEAGKKLAEKLQQMTLQDPVILALPRGGVPLAVEIASELHAPMDLLMVKKIGLPMQEELAVGAVSEDGVVVYNKEILKLVPALSKEMLKLITEDAMMMLHKKMEKFRKIQSPVTIENREVVVVDDGIATGQSVMAVIKLLRKRGAKKIIIAAPVAPVDTVNRLKDLADEVIVLSPEEFFYAVGEFYEDFTEVTDDEVIEGLRKKPHWSNHHTRQAKAGEHTY
jgi:putative phosphoribosyl transferase